MTITPASRVVVFDKSGIPIADLVTAVDRQWTLSGFAPAKFSLATADANTSAAVLQYGNYILVTHEKLPPWGGVIEPPRRWGYHTVEVNAYSAEYLLKRRVTPPKGAVLRNCAGANFRWLLSYANKAADTLIRAGSIYGDGPHRTDEITQGTIYDEVARIAKESTEEWRVVPVQDDHTQRLSFLAHWYKKLVNPRATTLYEGVREEGENLLLSDNALTESTEIVNDVRGYGAASTDDDREVFTAKDKESISDYGLHQGYYLADGSNEASAVEDATRSYLKKNAQPQKVFDLYALDIGGVFYDLDLGNVLGLSMQNVGFSNAGFGLETKVRITGMQYSDLPDPGKVRLVLEEYTE